MKYVRYRAGTTTAHGILEGDAVHEVTGDIYSGARRTGRILDLSDLKLLAPCEPSKIVAIGLNYADHAAEAKRQIPDEPIIFMKAPTSIIGPDEAIVLPSQDRRTDHEAELVIVMGKKCRKVGRNDALKYVFGYTCGNDVSDRIIQRKDGQWVRAKSFDTFCPLGPIVETDLDPDNLGIKTLVNSIVKQDSNTRHLIFSCSVLIEAVSAVMTLLPGDIIMTGTPEGVSPIKHGDVVEVVVEKIGTLRNPVVFDGGTISGDRPTAEFRL